MSNLFNHVVRYEIELNGSELGVDLRRVSVDYDDPFGIRRRFEQSFLANKVAYIRVGGTAMSSVDVAQGVVIDIDRDSSHLFALCRANVIKCIYSEEECFEINDYVFLVEHMMHEESGKLGLFDTLATKRNADFRLNSIRLVLFNKNDVEVGVIYIDPYLLGRVHYGYPRTEY